MRLGPVKTTVAYLDSPQFLYCLFWVWGTLFLLTSDEKNMIWYVAWLALFIWKICYSFMYETIFVNTLRILLNAHLLFLCIEATRSINRSRLKFRNQRQNNFAVFYIFFFFCYTVPSRLSYRRSSPTERTQMTNGRRSTARHLHPHPPPRADALVALASRRRRRRCAGAWSVERGAAPAAAAEAASVDSIQFLFHFYLILCCCRWRWGAL